MAIKRASKKATTTSHLQQGMAWNKIAAERPLNPVLQHSIFDV
jgi:hypothetical protein